MANEGEVDAKKAQTIYMSEYSRVFISSAAAAAAAAAADPAEPARLDTAGLYVRLSEYVGTRTVIA